MRVLLLEDDLQLGKALQSALSQDEFQPVWVRRVQEANNLLKEEAFVALLLDIGLPDGSGLEVLESLRKEGKHIPVIMLTARDALEDRIKGLDMGADDYLPKPFAVPELISRLRAVIRRSSGFADKAWRIGTLCIEPAKHKVSLGNVTLDLSVREYDLLMELARQAGRYVTRAKLEQAIFKNDTEIESNALEVHVHHLRKKLGADRIKTIRGVGYLLEDAL